MELLISGLQACSEDEETVISLEQGSPTSQTPAAASEWMSLEGPVLMENSRPSCKVSSPGFYMVPAGGLELLISENLAI